VVLRVPEGGELGAAFVADRRIAADEVFAFCRRMFPPYVQPAHVFQLEDLPRNGNGKLDRVMTRTRLEHMATLPPAARRPV
jgi:acyl-CoA synthetase (AMP-forming)/AMP-acid ligase II